MDVKFEGALEKTASGVFKNKSKIWMVLENMSISFFKDQTKNICIGSIEVPEITVARVTGEKGGQEFEIITSTKSYTFLSESADSTTEWVKIIESARTPGPGQPNFNGIKESKSATKAIPLQTTTCNKTETINTPQSPTHIFGVTLRPARSRTSTVEKGPTTPEVVQKSIIHPLNRPSFVKRTLSEEIIKEEHNQTNNNDDKQVKRLSNKTIQPATNTPDMLSTDEPKLESAPTISKLPLTSISPVQSEEIKPNITKTEGKHEVTSPVSKPRPTFKPPPPPDQNKSSATQSDTKPNVTSPVTSPASISFKPPASAQQNKSSATQSDTKSNVTSPVTSSTSRYFKPPTPAQQTSKGTVQTKVKTEGATMTVKHPPSFKPPPPPIQTTPASDPNDKPFQNQVMDSTANPDIDENENVKSIAGHEDSKEFTPQAKNELPATDEPIYTNTVEMDSNYNGVVDDIVVNSVPMTDTSSEVTKYKSEIQSTEGSADSSDIQTRSTPSQKVSGAGNMSPRSGSPTYANQNVDTSDVIMRNSNRISSRQENGTTDDTADVDISQVEMRKSSRSSRSSTLRGTASQMSIRDSKPRRSVTDDYDTADNVAAMRISESKMIDSGTSQNLSLVEDDGRDDDVFQDDAIKRILDAADDVETGREFPNELCLDAFKKLKAYLDSQERDGFDTDAHVKSVSDPVTALKELLKA